MINPLYFEGIENPKILELVLFCIDREINLHESLQQSEGTIVLADQYEQTINDIVRKLYADRKLVADYSRDNQRLKLAHPFWITNHVQDDYENIRQYFKFTYSGQKALAGDINVVKNKIDQIITEKGYTVEQIEKAAKAYIDNCIQNNRWMKTLPNFLGDATGSTLSIFIEDVESQNIMNNDFSRFI